MSKVINCLKFRMTSYLQMLSFSEFKRYSRNDDRPLAFYNMVNEIA